MNFSLHQSLQTGHNSGDRQRGWTCVKVAGCRQCQCSGLALINVDVDSAKERIQAGSTQHRRGVITDHHV